LCCGKEIIIRFSPGKGEKKKLHTHRNPITQRESNTLRLATDADVASDSACFRSLHAEVGQCILA